MSTRINLGEYQAWINIEGKEVIPYGLEVDPIKKVATCWIASETGKHFSIQSTKMHTRFGCVMETTLDGSYMGRSTLAQQQTGRPAIKKGVPTGDGNMRMFMFSGLELTDDDAFLNAPAASKPIGEMKINIYRAVLGDVAPATIVKAPEMQKVHERSKKAIAHQIRCGEKVPQVVVARRCQLFEMVATFIFRYRSLDMLQANGIAPRETSPLEHDTLTGVLDTLPPPTSKRKAPHDLKEEGDDVLDPQDAADKVKEAELLAEVERIRAGRNARKSSQPAKKKVKQEAQPLFLPGEIIDLTL